MTFDRQAAQRRRARRPRRSIPWRPLLGVVLLVCVFGVGVALGEALHDNPKPGGTRTIQRTLKPLPLPPARETVTVTVRSG